MERPDVFAGFMAEFPSVKYSDRPYGGDVAKAPARRRAKLVRCQRCEVILKTTNIGECDQLDIEADIDAADR